MYKSDRIATRLFIRQLKEKDILVTLSGTELKIKTKAANKISADLLDEIRNRKEELIDYLKYYSLDLTNNESSIEVTQRNEHTLLPLSYAQERLWFIDELEGSLHYHIPAVLRVYGSLDITRLEAAFRGVLARHEVLRSVIREQEGVAYQQVRTAEEWKLDIQQLPVAYKEATVSSLLETPFDLSHDYMLRASLQQYADGEQLLVIVLHHIAADGWSMPLLVQELIALYEGKASQLSPLEIQYADYAIWERSNLTTALMSEGLTYWKEQLSGVLPLELPTDHPRAVESGKTGGQCYGVLEAPLVNDLERLSQQQGVTLYMTLLSAFQVLLYRYSGQADICVGSPVANRGRAETEPLIGFFVNTLAVRTHVQPEHSFSSLLQQVRTTMLDAYHYQHIPFEKVVEEVGVAQDRSRHPLFQVMFVMQHTSQLQQLVLQDGVTLSYEPYQQASSKFDLTLEIRITGTQLNISIAYNAELFNAATIQQMLVHYRELLLAIVSNSEEQVGRLRLLTVAEEHQLLHTFNSIPFHYPDSTIVQLFSEQVSLHKEKTAVRYGDTNLSYGSLDEQSTVIAHILQAMGVVPGSLVPVCMERTPDLLIALLAILKAGAAYVPLDPNYPVHRINHIMEDTAATLILSDDIHYTIAASTGRQVININRVEEYVTTAVFTPPVLSANNLAYVMYTSGSTGMPKGVMVEHASVIRLVKSANYISFNSEHVLLATAAVSFDATIFEYWGMLLNGGTLVFCQQHELLNTQLLGNALSFYNVTLIWFTASWLHQLIDNDISIFSGIKTLIAGGDKLSTRHIHQLLAHYPALEVINGYGPTENTTFSLCHKISANAINLTDNIPIGKPISNSTAYILHNGNTLCPIGIPGEICVGGVGIARGYLNRDELTAEKFIANPFSKVAGSRLYRTGDIGYWQQDGTIMFVGRKDEQVKIRGYRIELGEIESVLQQHQGVRQCVVKAVEDTSGSQRMVAYVVSEGDFDKPALVSWMQSRLPDYMIPSVLIPLDVLPLTANGKVNKQALPSATDFLQQSRTYTAPRNLTEQAVAEIWSTLLGIPQVSVYDNFFELGGHSLLAARVMSQIRERLGVEVGIRELFRYPVAADLAFHISVNGKRTVLPPLVLQTRPQQIPLSYAQERLWFIDQLEGSLHYHIPTVLRVYGSLDIMRLEAAFRGVLSRHEVLRSVIREQEGIAYQQVRSAEEWKLDIQQLPVADKEATVSSLLQAPFDLSYDYMLRASLQQYADGEQLLVIVLHHIAADGWSMPLLVQELIALYEGKASQLSPLGIQYADYAIWERSNLTTALMSEGLTYWKEQLSGVLPLELPTDHPRAAAMGNIGGRSYGVLEAPLVNDLEKLSQQQGVTLYMTLLSAFQVLLYRYSGQADICVGSPVANRGRAETEPLIGFFVNTLAVRTHVQPEQAFSSLLQQVRTTMLDAYHYQHIPFEKVVEAVGVAQDRSRHPLFQVMFAMQQAVNAKLVVGDAVLEEVQQEYIHSKFDLTLELHPLAGENGYSLTVTYNRDLYSQWRIEALISHYLQLLRSVLAAPGQVVGELPLMNAEEQALLNSYNDTAINYPSGQTLPGLFSEQAKLRGNNTALLFENHELSYAALESSSNQLAHYLQERGVGREVMVAICLERSIEMVIGILGILKAGGAYVPIDPSYPQERIDYILSDTRSPLILSKGATAQQLRSAGLQVVDLDCDWKEISQQPGTELRDGPQPQDLAYVIYTSGSTGRPKGVLVEHQQVLNRLYWGQQYFRLNEQETVLQKTTFCFDVSVWELFSPLLAGARLVMAGPEDHKDPEKIRLLIDKHLITFIHFVPSMLEVFLAHIPAFACSSLQRVLCSGEALKVTHVTTFKEKLGHATIYNLYGPTEAAIEVTYWKSNDHTLPTYIPIGKPIANTQLYIVDNNFHTVPIGIPGELCIGGVQVARGYLNQETLTTEKFKWINDTTRVYCTGDRARWMPDGNIEYLGRTDNQVKIRGHRIELEEIEDVLNRLPQVKQAAVAVKKDQADNSVLIGYVVVNGSLQQETLLNELKKQLPDYMLPAQLVELENMPLTGSGKLDRNALPEIQLTGSSAYIAPRNITEDRLSKIWQELLGGHQPGVQEHFFELGGNSLKMVVLKSRIKQLFGVDITLKTLFLLTDIASQADYIRNCKISGYEDIPLADKMEAYPLSSAQQRLWIISQVEHNNTAYNMSAIYLLKGEPDFHALEKSFRMLTDRHEILRTNFIETAAGVRQVIRDKGEQNFELKYETVPTGTNVSELRKRIIATVEHPMDLENDCLIKATVLHTGEQQYLLVFQTHHIISDGWSLGLTIRELLQYYYDFTMGSRTEPQPLRLQYKDYACWQLDRLHSAALTEARNYWHAQFADDIPLLSLQSTFTRPAKKTYKGKVCRKMLDQGLTNKLQELCGQEHITQFMLLLATLKTVLYKYTGQEDIVIGSPVAGRIHASLEEQLGFYANTLALRTRFSGTDSFRDLLRLVKETALNAFEYQEYPFDELVNDLVKIPDPARSPLFDVMLIHHDGSLMPGQQGLQTTGLTVSPYREDALAGTSKFDLSLAVQSRENNLELTLEYNTDLFDEVFATRMLTHYMQVLEQVVENRAMQLASFSCCSAEEVSWLNALNSTNGGYDAYTESVISLFEAQADQSPHEKALADEQQAYTYRQFNHIVNAYSRYLQQQFDITPGAVVAVMLPRSSWSVIAVLSIMKLGAVYVPIDSSLPETRIRYILSDALTQVLITSDAPSFETGNIQVALLSSFEERLWNGDNMPAVIANQTVSYIIYTSGSTGVPKGVKQTYLTLYNLIKWNLSYADKRAFKCHLQYASMGFDMSLHDIYATLCAGGTLYILTEEQRREIPQLRNYIVQNGITSISMTYSALQAVFNDYSQQTFYGHQLQQVIAAGEQLYVNGSLRTFLEENPDTVLLNYYGPTETHVITASRYCFSAGNIPVKATIGQPIWNSQVYILNKDKQMVPPGITGEIFLGGWNVAAGYQQNDVLTQQKFIPDTFMGEGNLYRTGDLGRWLPDGNIEYMGRMDDQVKIRGYRVEPGEITHVLCSHPDLAEAIAVVYTKEETAITAYLVKKEGVAVTINEVAAFLAGRLPHYMHPDHYVFMDHFPLTANGKINKEMLPPPDIHQRFSGVTYAAPVNQAEEKLLMLWQQTLGRNDIGVTHNFFEAGGQSLKAALLSTKINKYFSCFIKVSDIYHCPTIRELAILVNTRKVNHLPEIVQLEKRSTYEVSGGQEMILTFNEFNAAAGAVYNIPLSCVINTNLDVKRFRQALQYIVERHETLRTFFGRQHGKYFQTINDTATVCLLAEDITEMPVEEQQAYISMKQDNERHTPFDLEKYPLYRFLLIRTGSAEFVLMATFHHIIFDGWSVQILLKELAEIYTALSEERTPVLPSLPIQYRDYANWHTRMLSDGHLAPNIQYWIDKLRNAHYPTLLPVDFPYEEQQPDHAGALFKAVIPGQQLQGMDVFCKKEHMSSFVYLLSCVAVVLGDWADTTDVMIGLPVAGRFHEDLSNQIGFYVNMLPLYLQLDEARTFKMLAAKVEKEVLAALDNQMVPFTHIIQQLSASEGRTGRLFDVVVNMGNIDVRTSSLADEREIRKMFRLDKVKHDANILYTKNQLTITMYLIEGNLHLYFSYAKSLFKEETILMLHHRFQHVWNMLVAGEEILLHALKYPLISAAGDNHGDWVFDFNN